MNKLEAIKQQYKEGIIDKWQYIDMMYAVHANLFEYAELIGNTNIGVIEIYSNRVIMTFRDSEIKFICIKDDKRLAPFETLNFGAYEESELAMQMKLIEPGFNILDIGGNFGWYAMHIAKRNPHSKVYSFEPIPITYCYLNENVKLNVFKNIETFNFGFSDKEGSFDFYFNPSLSVNASLANVSNNMAIEKVKCIVKTLDNFSKNLNSSIDFIKCDVEGAELLVFKGGEKTLRKHHPIIFSEMLRKWTAKFDYHPNQIITFLKELGYLCFTLKESSLSIFKLVDNNTLETNYFFLHKEKHADQIKKYS